MSSLSITVKHGDYFFVGQAKITINKGNGAQCVVNISAPPDVQIQRSKIIEENLMTKVTPTVSNVQIRRKFK